MSPRWLTTLVGQMRCQGVFPKELISGFLSDKSAAYGYLSCMRHSEDRGLLVPSVACACHVSISRRAHLLDLFELRYLFMDS